MQYVLLLNEIQKGFFHREIDRQLRQLADLLNPSFMVVRSHLLPFCSGIPHPVSVVIPDLGRFARDLREGGVVSALGARLVALHTGDWIQLLWRMAYLARRLVVRDFNAGLQLLLQIEWAETRNYSPSALCLGAEIADISFLLGNVEAFLLFDRFARKRNRRWGLMTSHFCMAVDRLTEWDLKPDFVLAPFHPGGLGMRPTQKACENKQRQSSFPTIACFQGSLESLKDQGVEHYYSELGIKSVAVNYTQCTNH